MRDLLPVRVDRTEAKLVRSVEAARISGAFQGSFPAPLAAAPEDPVWIVTIAGDLGMTNPTRCGLMACQPQPIRWSTFVIDAHTVARNREPAPSMAGKMARPVLIALIEDGH